MKIIVGLGNPGKEYENTNHNAGYMVLDKLAGEFSAKFSKKGCDSELAEIYEGGEKVILAKPLTYMNNSGIAVKGLVKKYKINPSEELVIIADDFDIQEGEIKIKKQSGNTTHNGIKSIKYELQTNEFIRVKISIGSKPQFMDTADFVLSKIKNEKTYDAIDKGAEAISLFIKGEQIDKIMQKFN